MISQLHIPDVQNFSFSNHVGFVDAGGNPVASQHLHYRLWRLASAITDDPRDNWQLDALHCLPDKHDTIACKDVEALVPQINPNIIILSATGMTHKEDNYLQELCVHVI